MPELGIDWQVPVALGTALNREQFRVAQPSDMTVDETYVGTVVVTPGNKSSVIYSDRSRNHIADRSRDAGAGTFCDQHTFARFFHFGEFVVACLGNCFRGREAEIEIGDE